MNYCKLQDIYGTDISLSISGSGYYRIDFKNEDVFPEKKSETTGHVIPNCLSFTERQAEILYLVLGEMLDKDQ